MTQIAQVGDDFTSPIGIFIQYATYDAAQNTQLQLQRHTDLRSFQQQDVLAQPTMLSLDLLTMQQLNPRTMGDIEADTAVVRLGEQWTAGVVAPQTDRHHWKGITLACAVGTNITSSVLHA